MGLDFVSTLYTTGLCLDDAVMAVYHSYNKRCCRYFIGQLARLSYRTVQDTQSDLVIYLAIQPVMIEHRLCLSQPVPASQGGRRRN